MWARMGKGIDKMAPGTRTPNKTLTHVSSHPQERSMWATMGKGIGRMAPGTTIQAGVAWHQSTAAMSVEAMKGGSQGAMLRGGWTRACWGAGHSKVCGCGYVCVCVCVMLACAGRHKAAGTIGQ